MLTLRVGLVSAVAILAASLVTEPVSATVFNPAPNPIAGFTYTVTPGFSQSAYSDDAQSDINPQSPANVGTVLSSSAWFNVPLTFVGGGACGGSGVTCSGGDGSLSPPGGANVFGIHFDNKYLAFLYDPGIVSFSISGLGQDISGILAYNCDGCGGPGPGPGPGPVPIPGAAFLMGSVLAAGAAVRTYRRRRKFSA